MMVLAESNAFDVLVALVVGIPAIIGAVVGWLAWRSANHAKNTAYSVQEEVRSPNGKRSGQALYEMGTRIEGIESRQERMEIRQERMEGRVNRVGETLGDLAKTAVEGEARQRIILEGQKAVERGNLRHYAEDTVRFGALFKHMGIEDPLPDS